MNPINYAMEKWNYIIQAIAARQYLDAKKSLEEILALDPDNAVAHYGLAQTLLTLGDYERGFTEFEWRWQLNSPLCQWYHKIYDFSRRWDGSHLRDKTLIVLCDQGLGDAIQFSRYMKQVRERVAGRIIIHAHKPVAPLLEGEVVIADIGTDEHENFPPYDYFCPMMSLPYVLRDFQPQGQPYLSCDQRKIDGQGKKIGIVWGGRIGNTIDQEAGRNRSIPVHHFQKLLPMDVTLYRLQVEPRPDLGKADWLMDLTSDIQNMKEMGELMQGLDLIITCDTSTAHLAGALGCPCWLLLPYLACWRWGLGDTTPWYDSIRIFRQKEPDNWDTVFDEVIKSL